MRIGHKIHDYVQEITLAEIQPENVIFFMNSSMGAQGDGGATDLYSIQNGRVCYFYANEFDGFSLESIAPYLPKGLHYEKDWNWISADDKCWSLFGGGPGNDFYIRSDYFPLFMDRLLTTSLEMYYRAWHEPGEEFLKDILNGLKPEKIDSDAVAFALAQFALKGYIGEAHERDGITAALWCDTYGVCLPISGPIVVDNGIVRTHIGNDWKQNNIGGKFDRANIRINFGYKVAQIYASLEPDYATIKQYEIVIKGNRIQFLNERLIREFTE